MDRYQRSHLDDAETGNHSEIIEILLENGALRGNVRFFFTIMNYPSSFKICPFGQSYKLKITKPIFQEFTLHKKCSAIVWEVRSVFSF